LRHFAQPAEIANGNRIIETEFLPKHRPHFGRHVRIGRQLLERVARRERQDREQDDTDAENARDGDQEAPEKVLPH
jgi:hypothetical protein